MIRTPGLGRRAISVAVAAGIGCADEAAFELRPLEDAPPDAGSASAHAGEDAGPAPVDGSIDGGDGAVGSTFCTTVSPRPRSCADFDGADPWLGLVGAPRVSGAPASGCRLGDAGASSPPLALEVDAPPSDGGSSCIAELAHDSAGRRSAFAFDVTLRPDDAIAGERAILGYVLVSDPTPDASSTEVDVDVEFPARGEDAVWPSLRYFPPTPPAVVWRSSVPLARGVKTRVVVRVLREPSDGGGSARFELVLRGADGIDRVGVSELRDDVAKAGSLAGAVESRVAPASPHWRATFDNLVLTSD